MVFKGEPYMKFTELCEELTNEIKSAYESSVTVEEAEKLAGKFLYAQIQVSEELKTADLDSRMRKAGLKSLRSAIYMDVCAKAEKKPTEAGIDALINTDTLAMDAQKSFDNAESDKEGLERYYNIFREAHIFFRGIAKGRFE